MTKTEQNEARNTQQNSQDNLKSTEIDDCQSGAKRKISNYIYIIRADTISFECNIFS